MGGNWGDLSVVAARLLGLLSVGGKLYRKEAAVQARPSRQLLQLSYELRVKTKEKCDPS